MFKMATINLDAQLVSFDHGKCNLKRNYGAIHVLQHQQFTVVFHLLSTLCSWPCSSCDPTLGNLLDWDQMTMVANFADCHGQSIGQRSVYSDTVISSYWTVGSSHITITKPTDKMHIHLFITGKCKWHAVSLMV